MRTNAKVMIICWTFFSWIGLSCKDLQQPDASNNTQQEKKLKPIEQIFPAAFQASSGIYIQPQLIANLEGYAMQPFPATEKNRNHCDERPSDTSIQQLVLHYTVGNFKSSLHTFTSNIPMGRTSIHYMIAERDEALGLKGGELLQVVPENKRAWHTGPSFWRGVGSLNSTSIGIEAVNHGLDADPATKKPIKWYPFDERQIQHLGLLSQDIVKRNNILPYNVVGHSDIAPRRKPDPGILCPWGRLYQAFGVGAWLDDTEQDEKALNSRYQPKEPLPQGMSVSYLLTQLKSYGYDIKDTRIITDLDRPVVHAFQMHFSKNQRTAAYHSLPDREDMLWAWGLNVKYHLNN